MIGSQTLKAGSSVKVDGAVASLAANGSSMVVVGDGSRGTKTEGVSVLVAGSVQSSSSRTESGGVLQETGNGNGSENGNWSLTFTGVGDRAVRREGLLVWTRILGGVYGGSGIGFL